MDSHNAAITTCQHCEHRTGPGYIEPGVPWAYEAEAPVELATEIPVEGANVSQDKNNPWSDLDNYDPVKWASPGTIEQTPEQATPEPEVEKPQPKKRPAPSVPEGDPPDPEEVAVDLVQAKVEEERPKEPLVTTPDVMLTDAPAQTPAASPPPYQTFTQKPPPDIDVDPTLAKPTPDDLIAQFVAGSRGGPSIHGWSKISCGLHCLRKYFYDIVAQFKLRRKPDPDVAGFTNSRKYFNPLWLGGLMHDVRALHLITGGIHTWEPLYAIRGVHPEHALEAYRLMKHYLSAWGPNDNRMWDVRAVEVESRYYYKARRIGGKARRLCLSSRHDALVHPLRPGELRQPVGQQAPRIDINEFKSTKQMAQTTIEGYRVDGQALLHCGTFKYGNAVSHDGTVLEKSSEEIYGRLNSLFLDWVVKVVNFEPSKHLVRQQYIMPNDQIEHFLASIGDFYYEEIAKRLWHKRWQDPEIWPQRWMCRGIYYPSWICPYAPLCESTVRSEKTITARYDVGEPIDRMSLEMPKKRKKRTYKRKRAAAEVEAK